MPTLCLEGGGCCCAHRGVALTVPRKKDSISPVPLPGGIVLPAVQTRTCSPAPVAPSPDARVRGPKDGQQQAQALHTARTGALAPAAGKPNHSIWAHRLYKAGPRAAAAQGAGCARARAAACTAARSAAKAPGATGGVTTTRPGVGSIFTGSGWSTGPTPASAGTTSHVGATLMSVGLNSTWFAMPGPLDAPTLINLGLRAARERRSPPGQPCRRCSEAQGGGPCQGAARSALQSGRERHAVRRPARVHMRRGPVLPRQVSPGAGAHPTEISAGLTDAPVAPTDTAVGDMSIRLGATMAPAARRRRVSEGARGRRASRAHSAEHGAQQRMLRPGQSAPCPPVPAAARAQRAGGAPAAPRRIRQGCTSSPVAPTPARWLCTATEVPCTLTQSGSWMWMRPPSAGLAFSTSCRQRARQPRARYRVSQPPLGLSTPGRAAAGAGQRSAAAQAGAAGPRAGRARARARLLDRLADRVDDGRQLLPGLGRPLRRVEVERHAPVGQGDAVVALRRRAPARVSCTYGSRLRRPPGAAGARTGVPDGRVSTTERSHVARLPGPFGKMMSGRSSMGAGVGAGAVRCGPGAGCAGSASRSHRLGGAPCGGAGRSAHAAQRAGGKPAGGAAAAARRARRGAPAPLAAGGVASSSAAASRASVIEHLPQEPPPGL